MNRRGFFGTMAAIAAAFGWKPNNGNSAWDEAVRAGECLHTAIHRDGADATFILPAKDAIGALFHSKLPNVGQPLTDSNGLLLPFVCENVVCRPSPEPGFWMVTATYRRVENT